MQNLSKKEKIVIVLIILAFPFTVGSLFFITPWRGDFNLIDDGQMGAWASHMLHGKLMFRDIYITYGPFFIYPLYLLFKFFGPSGFLIKLLYGGFGTLIGIASAVLFISLFNFKRIVFYPLLFLLLFIPGLNIRQAAVFFFLWLLIKLHQSNNVYSLLAGMVAAVSFLLTPDAGVISILLLLLYFIFQFIFKKNTKDLLVKLMLIGAGIGIITLFFSSWAMSEGWLADYVSTTPDILASFSGPLLPNGKGFPNPLTFFFSTAPSFAWLKYSISKDMLLYYEYMIFIATFLYLGARKIKGYSKQSDFYLLMIALSGFIQYYSLVGRSGNFFLTLTPVLIILGYFSAKLLDSVKKTTVQKKLRVAALAMIVLFVLRILYIFTPSLNSFIQFKNQYSIYSEVDRIGSTAITESQAKYLKLVKDYIALHTISNDYIFFLSNEPLLYMLTDRVNPTRYDLPYIAHTREKRYEMLSDLRKKSPKLIFYDNASWPVDEISNIRRLPEVISFIESHYYKKYIGNGRVVVYTLKK